MILKHYNKFFNNLEKIKKSDVKDKKSLENISNLKKDLIKIKEFGKSSTKKNNSLLDGININYKVIEDELNNLRDIFLKDNLFDEMELELSHSKLKQLFDITHNLNSIKEVTNKKTLIFEILNLTLDKTKPVFSDLFINELNQILNSKNIKVINNELLKFKNNLDNKTTLFLNNYQQIIDKNKIDISSLIVNSKYIAYQLNNNIVNLDDYLEKINENLNYIFKNLHDLLQTYADYSHYASDEINKKIKTSLKKSALDNQTILKEIEIILINTKDKIDLDTENALAEREAEAEKKSIDEENKKSQELAREEAKRLALEKAQKEAKEKELQEQKDKERKSTNSLILGYIIIFLGVILCCWGLWELGIFLWDNYSTEIKWITAILVASFIILLYLAEYKLISFLLGVTCLSLWFYLSEDTKTISNKSDNDLSIYKEPNKKSNYSEKLKSQTDTKNNIKNNLVSKTYGNGKYTGYFKNNKRHGRGTYVFNSGSKYVGQWKNGQQNGNGVFTYKSGTKLTGKFDNGLPSYGTELYVGKWSGDKYIGNFKNWNRDGQGTYFYKNGDKYVGQWKNGKKHGSGVLTTRNQTTKGIWENDKFQKVEKKSVKKIKPNITKKILEKASSQTNTKNNIKNNLVSKTYGNGKYTGYFKNNKRHGRGTYVFNSGSKYVGQWKNGQQNGNGVFTYKSGTKLTGKFDNGLPSYGTELYVGKWSGDKYIGNFKNWNRDGQGTYFYKNGDKYVGQWKNGKKHGSGVLTTRNQTTKGIWENDKFIYATGSANP